MDTPFPDVFHDHYYSIELKNVRSIDVEIQKRNSIIYF